MSTCSEKLSRPAYDDLGEDEGLTPILPEGAPPTLAAWEARRRELLERWNEVLGAPTPAEFDRTAELVESFDLPECRATTYLLPTGPETKQFVLLMAPLDADDRPRPAALVPFYNPDAMAGYDLATRELKERPTVHFGRHLVQQGYLVLCGQAFPYNTVPDPQSDAGFAWWHAGTDKVLAENPEWTGMGKLIWDTRLATDFLLEQPDVDPDRVVAIGHSLGGKMAFYNGCLDERIKAIIASDFGIGFGFTNWDAPWYLGDKVHDPGLGLAHHHLLALNAPRSFLIIAGQFDGPASWQYLNEVREIYKLFGREHALGIFDHASGHTPTEEAMRAAYTWLAEQFGLPERPWRL